MAIGGRVAACSGPFGKLRGTAGWVGVSGGSSRVACGLWFSSSFGDAACSTFGVSISTGMVGDES